MTPLLRFHPIHVYKLTVFRPAAHLLLVTLLLSLISGKGYAGTSALAAHDSLVSESDTLIYEIDEVVVTGTRNPMRIIDIPYSVVRITQNQFKYDRKTSINDVLGFVPGLFMQSRYGNHDVRISIRGFGSRSNTGIRGIRILLDGIPESEPDGQTRIEAIDFNSVGSIEIVKGNSSSLYTNAPGGVVNFINDIYFPSTFANSFNEFGSFSLSRNGIKAGLRTDDYRFLLTYGYHNYRGYREHSEDFWHITNTVLEVRPSERSKLQVLGYFVDGLIRLPGSLTKEEFAQDPFQAAKLEKDFDFRRISKKGRLGLRFSSFFGENNNNELELTTYGTIKYFERTSRIYRIINRYGVGASFRFVHKNTILGMKNEFSVGGDLLYQTGPIEFYTNINGKKSDILTGLNDETIGNTGFYFQNSLDIYERKLSLFLTGRYDKVVFDQKNLILESQNDVRRFEAFTPKIGLNYKLTPSIALYTSYGVSFDSPAANELDNFPISSNPGKLLNPDLEAQDSKNLEVGIKGNVVRSDGMFMNNVFFEATFFNSVINAEIVPFEVFSEVFFRNSAKTTRTGLELGVNTKVYGGLGLKLAYTYSYFTYDEYTAQIIELDTGGNVVTSDKDFSGNVVPSVPRHNLSVGISFEGKLTEDITGFIKGDYMHVSGMFVDDANSERTVGYDIFGTTLGVDVLIGRFNILVSGGVRNMFDVTHVAFININSATKRFYEAGEPRNYFGSARLGYSF